MLYLLIFFYLTIIIIVGWIKNQITKPPHLVRKQIIGLHIAFAVSIPVFIFLLIFFINEFTLLDWAIAGGFTLIFGVCALYQYNKKKVKMTPEELERAREFEMASEEERVKIVKCRNCGRLYNKYARPSGAKMVCSEECRVVYTEQLQAETKKNLKTWQKWEAINCLCFGILPIIVVIIIFLMIMNAAG